MSIVTVASYKGGVGKTTTAIHLAAYLSKFAPTLLIDGDAIRAAIRWSQRGPGFPFEVCDERQTARFASRYASGHIVIDTEANPSNTDFKQVAEGCDLMVIPAVPETTATDGLRYTLDKLKEIGSDRYRVLLTKVRPRPNMDGPHLRAMLLENKFPVFTAEVPQLVAFDKASTEGVIVNAVKDERAERGWSAYEAAGKEITNGKRKR